MALSFWLWTTVFIPPVWELEEDDHYFFFACSDFPEGVVNMVYGLGPSAGEALITHPDVPIVSFTGSTGTGKHIAQATAPMFKKLSLEVSKTVYVDCWDL